MSSPPPKLPFSDKYDLDHARAYEEKHRSGLRRRLTTWREIALARRALRLAGDPESVLDMPCGAGRFWPMLAEHPTRRLRAGDRSAGMLETARAHADPALLTRFDSIGELDAFAQAAQARLPALLAQHRPAAVRHKHLFTRLASQ